MGAACADWLYQLRKLNREAAEHFSAYRRITRSICLGVPLHLCSSGFFSAALPLRGRLIGAWGCHRTRAVPLTSPHQCVYSRVELNNCGPLHTRSPGVFAFVNTLLFCGVAPPWDSIREAAIAAASAVPAVACAAVSDIAPAAAHHCSGLPDE